MNSICVLGQGGGGPKASKRKRPAEKKTNTNPKNTNRFSDALTQFEPVGAADPAQWRNRVRVTSNDAQPFKGCEKRSNLYRLTRQCGRRALLRRAPFGY